MNRQTISNTFCSIHFGSRCTDLPQLRTHERKHDVKDMIASIKNAEMLIGQMKTIISSEDSRQWITVIEPTESFCKHVLEEAGINCSRVRIARKHPRQDKVSMLERAISAGTSETIIVFGNTQDFAHLATTDSGSVTNVLIVEDTNQLVH
ncbi:hypothetical protein CS022_03875 [Veronia nyctiphanis]|uniref:Uncharacterized protein n=1 Tax=Veronia nyctiphanis TaxID=1278244 RepID=A0A4Q0YSJ8_9GAMM|nr:hypothetical protein [Veronia nyctiphanis]RXJ74217.1 hypothetical protein CS022_03875 [Veronia nyctiphanis]